MISLTITAPDGNCEAIRTIKIADWTGQALLISRAAFLNMKDRSEINKPGIYILLNKTGDSDNKSPRLYVGEGDPAKTRIEAHAKNLPWWSDVLVFTSATNNLDKTKIQWIEAELIRAARKNGSARVEQNKMNYPTVDELVEAQCAGFAKKIIACTQLLNLNYFSYAENQTEQTRPEVITKPTKAPRVVTLPTPDIRITPPTPVVAPVDVKVEPDKDVEIQDPHKPHEIPKSIVNIMFDDLIARGMSTTEKLDVLIIGDERLISKISERCPRATISFCGIDDRHNKKVRSKYGVSTVTNLFDASGVQFDLIIGNPPYNEAPSGTSSVRATIWHLFVNKSLEMSKRYVSMIVPARWYTGGAGLGDFRDSFGANKNLVSIYDMLNGVPEWESAEVDIKGGVCYFLIDKNKTSDTCKWVNTETHETWTRSIPLLTSGVVLRHLHQQRVVDLVKQRADEFLIPFSINGYNLKTNDYPTTTGTPCWFNSIVKNKFNLETNLGKINKPFIDRDGNLNTYRVITSFGYNDWTHKKVLSPSTFVASPGEICTASFVVLKSFTNRRSAENFRTYITTKFARYLIRCVKTTQASSPKVYQFVPIVPDQPWTDEELYRHFRIPKDLVNIIETTIDEWRDDDQDD